jgi:hypothetical protein
MDKDKALDYSATGIGGTLGLDQLYQAVNDLTTDGATGNEWAALAKGVVLIVFGYFAWRRSNRPAESK